MRKFILPFFFFLLINSCVNSKKEKQPDLNLEKAIIILDSLYHHYDAGNNNLLRPYPYEADNTLALEENNIETKEYSELWPYSGTLSAATALLEATSDRQYLELLDNKILIGLDNYFDDKRSPAGYATNINSTSDSKRVYEDNVWPGIDLTDIYLKTHEAKYLDKAKLIWQFVVSGMDDNLGGGIYRCEQDRTSKSTCVNAAASVFAFKLFEATKDIMYFEYGQLLYEWTKTNLQDTQDYLYFDRINLEGLLARAKYGYNNGLMMQAAVLLHKLTDEDQYLIDAERIADAAFDYFFDDFEAENGEEFKLLRKGNVWSMAVMMRGFVDLYYQDGNSIYVEAFAKNLDYAWENMRDSSGLFGTDWSGVDKRSGKWLLTEAAIVEMYARMARINNAK